MARVRTEPLDDDDDDAAVAAAALGGAISDPTVDLGSRCLAAYSRMEKERDNGYYAYVAAKEKPAVGGC